MHSSQDLSGKTAVVTGAGGGIGGASSMALARAGADVICRRSAQRRGRAAVMAIFGGAAPYSTTYMTSNGPQGYIWVYVAAAASVGLAVYLTMPETRARSLESATPVRGAAWAEGANPV